MRNRVADLEEKIAKTLRHYGRTLIRALRGARWGLSPVTVSRPVFIVGCSRAGTTLVYKAFSEARELGSLQRETHDFWAELHPLAEQEWRSHALAAADASPRDRAIVARYFYIHTGRGRFVDKNNQNGLCVPYLLALFPDAHFIYVKRSPGDNLNSLMEGWSKPDEFATWSQTLPATVAVDGGRFTRWCFFLPPGWRDYLTVSLEEVCALQYRTMNEALVACRDLVPARQWTEIFYEDLLRDPKMGFRHAFEAAGIVFSPELELHCAEVLATPYNAFSEIRRDKWRDGRNRARIERVLPSVAAVAKAMGYDLDTVSG
jgi:hypothetical protein